MYANAINFHRYKQQQYYRFIAFASLQPVVGHTNVNGDDKKKQPTDTESHNIRAKLSEKAQYGFI